MQVITNITRGKRADASSYVMPYRPSRAVDGSSDKSSRWLSASSKECWLSIDLGGYHKVTGWSVSSIGSAKWDTSCNLNSFIIQGSATYSDINKEWFTINTISNSTDNYVQANLNTPKVVNALRVYVTKGDSRETSNLASILDFTAMGYPVSHNSYLSNLTLSSGTLTPAFQKELTSYTAEVPNNVTSITITPTAGDADASITVNNQAVNSGKESQPINLNLGPNIISVVVISPSTMVKSKYTITVTRQGNTYLSNLTLSKGNLIPAFAPNITSYNVEVDNSVSSLTVTPTAQNPGTDILVNGTIVQSGSASGPINLNVGQNIITVQVKPANGNVLTYMVAVTRAASAVYLASLVIQAPDGTEIPLNTLFSKDVLNYTASIGDSFTNVKVIAASSDKTTKVIINGQTVESGSTVNITNLKVGITKITVSLDKGTKEYTVDLSRASSPYLANLVLVNVDDGSVIKLTPEFSMTNKTYSATTKASSVAVIPTAEDASGAEIKVNSEIVNSGSQSYSYPVKSRPSITQITVKVTSGNGDVYQYVLRVSKG